MRNRFGGMSFFNSQPFVMSWALIFVQDSRRDRKLVCQSCARVSFKRMARAYSGEGEDVASRSSKTHSDFRKSSRSGRNWAEPSPTPEGSLSLNHVSGARDNLS